MRAYQEQVLRRRIDQMEEYSSPQVALDPALQGGKPFEIPEEAADRFVQWLQEQYNSLAALNEAWNMDHAGIAAGCGPRDELWQARKEPLVGVFSDWDNEAICAAMTAVGRDCFKQLPINARIGVGRALIIGG